MLLDRTNALIVSSVVDLGTDRSLTLVAGAVENAEALQNDQPVSGRPAPVPWAEAPGLLCWSCWSADDAMLHFLIDGQDFARRHVTLLARVGLTGD